MAKGKIKDSLTPGLKMLARSLKGLESRVDHRLSENEQHVDVLREAAVAHNQTATELVEGFNQLNQAVNHLADTLDSLNVPPAEEKEKDMSNLKTVREKQAKLQAEIGSFSAPDFKVVNEAMTRAFLSQDLTAPTSDAELAGYEALVDAGTQVVLTVKRLFFDLKADLAAKDKALSAVTAPLQEQVGALKAVAAQFPQLANLQARNNEIAAKLTAAEAEVTRLKTTGSTADPDTGRIQAENGDLKRQLSDLREKYDEQVEINHVLVKDLELSL